ncbi:MAG: IS1380 family transposase [Candidatus Methylomirabilota bacterium]
MPKGPRKFHFAFERAGLTRFGGLCLFHQFCKSLRCRHFLQLSVRWPGSHHRTYHPADLFLAHLFASVAGIGRIESTQSLVHNGLLPPLLGLPDFPHRDTLRTFLWRFGPQDLQHLQTAHDKLRAHLFPRLGLRYSAIVDADTTALVTHGQQEGTAVGYLRKRRHRQRSYAPLLASEGCRGLSLGGELRAGNVPANRGAGPFLEGVLGKLPTSIAPRRARLRLDAAFYDKAIVQALTEERVGYAIVARMTERLGKSMVAARYHEFAAGWEAAAFASTPFHWRERHRFIAVRRPAALEPEELQRHFFTFKRYTYHRVLVTNLEITPAPLYRFYCDRGFQELLLREFKSAYHLAQIPTRSFWANATYLELVLWAYDLVVAFQLLCLPPEVQHWNIATLRRELWWLPAQWVKRGGSSILWLPAKYPHQELFARIQTTAGAAPLI